MANYGIIRMAKFQMSAVQGIQKHNQRQGKSKTNPDIEEAKSNLNYDLINEQKIKYEQTIKEKISERVSRKPRENSVVLSEFLVTASPEYMQSLSDQEQKKYFASSLEFVKKQYGAENVLYAVVHQDEANPHMHVGIVPITKDNRLSAKDIFNGKQAMIKLQDNFHEHMVKQGFNLERGESKVETLREHVSVYDLKKNTENELKLLQEGAKQLTKAIEFSKSVEKVEFEEKKNLIGSFKGSKTVKLAFEDFNYIKGLAKQTEVLKTSEKVIKNEFKVLTDKNISLKNQNKQLQKEKQRLNDKVANLEKENERLVLDLKRFEVLNRYYVKVIEEMKRLSEKYLKVDLERIRQFTGQIRMATVGKVFGESSIGEKYMKALVPEDEYKGAMEYIEFANKRKEQKIAEEKEPIENEREESKNIKDDLEMER